MCVASRIESTGEPNMIHVSEDTANILMAAGRSDWITPRDALVSAKGKGFMQTYWLTMKPSRQDDTNTKKPKMISDTASEHSDVLSEHSGGGADNEEEDQAFKDQRTKRLIDWNVEVLHSQLKKIVAMRDPEVDESKRPRKRTMSGGDSLNLSEHNARLRFDRDKGKTVLDEVMEVIPLSNKASSYHRNPEMVILDKNVVIQVSLAWSYSLANQHTNEQSLYDYRTYNSLTHSGTSLCLPDTASRLCDYHSFHVPQQFIPLF